MARRIVRVSLIAITPVFLSLGFPDELSAQIMDQSGVVVPPRPARSGAIRSAFTRNANVAVLDRMLGAFSAQGISLGAFDLFPGITFGAGGSSNAFADNGNRHAVAQFVARPEATLRTRGGPIDFDIYGRGAIKRVTKFATENVETVVGGAKATLNSGSLNSFSIGGSYARDVLPREAEDSPRLALKPLEFSRLVANVGGTIEGGRTRLIARGDFIQLRFRNTPRIGGGTLLTGDRDRDTLTGLVRLERSLGPSLSLYVAGSGNRIEYRIVPPSTLLDRDSSGFGAFVGSSFELTHLLRGDFRVGYIQQNFRSPVFQKVAGLGLDGSLQYFPTQLTDITVRGNRSVQDSGVPGTAGYVHTGGEIQLDHEFRRYLMGSILVGAGRDRYRGLSRTDDTRKAAASATYLSRNHWNVKVGYEYERRHSGDPITTASFDEHRLVSSMTIQF